MDMKLVAKDNVDYIDNDSLSALEQLDVEVYPALVAACVEMGQADPGVDCKIATTHESLDDLENSRVNHWTECNSFDRLILAGLNAIAYYAVQIHRGEKRHDLVVVDCGDLRAVLTF